MKVPLFKPQSRFKYLSSYLIAAPILGSVAALNPSTAAAAQTYILNDGSSQVSGSNDACGAPNYDSAVDAGVFLWRDCDSGLWHLRAAAGGDAASYSGRIVSDRPFANAAPVSLESSDVFDASATSIEFALQMRGRWEDGFDFALPENAQIRVELDDPAPVMLGENRTSVDVPVVLSDFTPLPASDACGAPSYNAAEDAGVFLWRDCDSGLWRLRAAAGGDTARYIGRIVSDGALTNVVPRALESNDVFDASATAIEFSLRVGGSGQDGFDFAIPAGVQTRIELNTDALILGENRTEVDVPLALSDFAPSLGLETCGAPSYDPAVDAGIVVWQDCDTGLWHLRAAAGGNTTTYGGRLISDRPIADTASFKLESNDVFDTSATAIAFTLQVRGRGEDGFDFTLPEGAQLRLELDDSAPVMLGENLMLATPVGGIIAVPDLDEQPVARADRATVEQGQSVAISVLANDDGLLNEPITVSMVGTPTSGTARITSDNRVQFTAASGSQETVSMSYRVTDVDGDSAVASVNVDVECSTCVPDREITLRWNRHSETVTGYWVVYGPSASSTLIRLADLYINNGDVDPRSPSVSFALNRDLGAEEGDNVCFKVGAFNNQEQSRLSQAVCTRL